MQICLILYGYFKRVRKFAKSVYWLRHVCVSVCPFFRMEQTAHNVQIFFKVSYLIIFRKSVNKI
jgi:hypothetical protein